MIALAVMPVIAVPLVVYALVLNASGAVGDVAVSLWLLRQPVVTLVRDEGTAMTFYGPVREQSSVRASREGGDSQGQRIR